MLLTIKYNNCWFPVVVSPLSLTVIVPVVVIGWWFYTTPMTFPMTLTLTFILTSTLILTSTFDTLTIGPTTFIYMTMSSQWLYTISIVLRHHNDLDLRHYDHWPWPWKPSPNTTILQYTTLHTTTHHISYQCHIKCKQKSEVPSYFHQTPALSRKWCHLAKNIVK